LTKQARFLADYLHVAWPGPHTAIMNAVLVRGLTLGALLVVTVQVGKADEITLKDGKVFYGSIVAYDNNMFKVKTDFGFVMVEKSKIASIVPMVAEPAKGTQPAVKRSAPAEQARPEAEPVKIDAAKSQPTVSPAVEMVVERPAPRVSAAPVRPQLPVNSARSTAIAPSIKAVPTAAAAVLARSTTPLAQEENHAPIAPEEVQGNVYTNHTYGFRMYKAPSWQLIEDPTALPNAIVAMGTPNESTLMVVGREKSKQSLESTAAAVESRLHDVYEGYKQVSQRKTTICGALAIEYRYRGNADGHDWSGTLVVIGRGSEIFTAIGMTYADNDLIQIQENVIARAIASLDFTAY
jgi:hypothetical protein